MANALTQRRPPASYTINLKQQQLGAALADATPPAWNGYLLTVACSCGMVFGRGITPRDAELDLLRAAR